MNYGEGSGLTKNAAKEQAAERAYTVIDYLQECIPGLTVMSNARSC